MQIIEKLEKNWDEGKYEEKNHEAEPFPGHPKNKKCKCGLNLPYKSCCYK